MSKLFYYPSCKFIARFPEAGTKIKSYLAGRYEPKGCCRADLASITSDDTIVYICNSCAAFFEERTLAREVVSIWELIANDKNFPFPKHENKRMSVQDCWRTYDNATLQNAVRKILSVMNIEVVEQKSNREKTKFCGKSLYEPLPKGYEALAPKRLVKNAQGLFVSHTEEEKALLMKEHCQAIETDDVVCYCLACMNGINVGGKAGIHLAELVFEAV